MLNLIYNIFYKETSRTSISQSMENLSFNKKKNTASSTLSSSSSGTGVKVEYDL
jgi:hypothetical protein